ncbi:capsule biosynthesis protein CapA, partial [Mesorhizobium sp. M8A.F.Ca.ET.059.01.1.1]
FYGLGNFLFHVHPEETEWNPPEVWQSIVAACRYEPGGSLEGIDLLPVGVGGEAQSLGSATGRLMPVAVTGREARDILEGFATRSRAFGVEIEVSSTWGRIALPAARKFG